jgi:hypothetical protein
MQRDEHHRTSPVILRMASGGSALGAEACLPGRLTLATLREASREWRGSPMPLG